MTWPKIERSNEKDALSKKVRPSLPIPPKVSAHRAKLSTHSAVTCTPLGVPVASLVNRM